MRGGVGGRGFVARNAAHRRDTHRISCTSGAHAPRTGPPASRAMLTRLSASTRPESVKAAWRGSHIAQRARMRRTVAGWASSLGVEAGSAAPPVARAVALRPGDASDACCCCSDDSARRAASSGACASGPPPSESASQSAPSESSSSSPPRFSRVGGRGVMPESVRARAARLPRRAAADAAAGPAAARENSVRTMCAIVLSADDWKGGGGWAGRTEAVGRSAH